MKKFSVNLIKISLEKDGLGILISLQCESSYILLGKVNCGAADVAQRRETFTDGMDVGQVHELDVAVGVVLGAFTAASPCAVRDSCCV